MLPVRPRVYTLMCLLRTTRIREVLPVLVTLLIEVQKGCHPTWPTILDEQWLGGGVLFKSVKQNLGNAKTVKLSVQISFSQVECHWKQMGSWRDKIWDTFDGRAPGFDEGEVRHIEWLKGIGMVIANIEE